jgi:hypothetical protein
MRQRGIPEDEVLRLLRSVEPFSYNQHGTQHVGYYDSSTRLFAAVAEGVLVTVFHTRPSYVEGLRRRGP